MSMELPLTVTVLKNASSEPLDRTAFVCISLPSEASYSLIYPRASAVSRAGTIRGLCGYFGAVYGIIILIDSGIWCAERQYEHK